MSRQRANVALRRLQDLSLIRMGRQGLAVLDVDGPRRIAGGQVRMPALDSTRLAGDGSRKGV